MDRLLTPRGPSGPCAQTHTSWTHLQMQRPLAPSNAPQGGHPKGVLNPPARHAGEAARQCLVVGTNWETSPNGLSRDKKQPRSCKTGGGGLGGAFLPAWLGFSLHHYLSPCNMIRSKGCPHPQPHLGRGQLRHSDSFSQHPPGVGGLGPLSTHRGLTPTWGRRRLSVLISNLPTPSLTLGIRPYL